MKKHVVILILVFLALRGRAQNLTMSDITNLASLNSSDARNSLTYERPFREKYFENINGLTIDHYQGTTPASTCETVVIGYGGKTTAGVFLHTVTYASTNVKYLLHLIAQAKSAGLTEQFEGADATSNIYHFYNFLYTVDVYISNDHTKGSVTVKQNEINE